MPQLSLKGAIEIGGTIRFTLEEPPPLPEILAVVTTKVSGFSLRAIGETMAYTLPSKMQIQVGVQYQDASGNPATVDGPVLWSSSDETLLTVVAVDTPPPGYPSNGVCFVQAVGPIGQAQVTASADADLGSGLRNLTTLLDIAIVAGEAVAGTVAPIGDPSPV